MGMLFAFSLSHNFVGKPGGTLLFRKLIRPCIESNLVKPAIPSKNNTRFPQRSLFAEILRNLQRHLRSLVVVPWKPVDAQGNVKSSGDAAPDSLRQARYFPNISLNDHYFFVLPLSRCTLLFCRQNRDDSIVPSCRRLVKKVNVFCIYLTLYIT